MKDLKNRDFMSRLYRLMEKWEKPPEGMEVDELVTMTKNLNSDCQAILKDFPDNIFAESLLQAFLESIVNAAGKTCKK